MVFAWWPKGQPDKNQIVTMSPNALFSLDHFIYMDYFTSMIRFSSPFALSMAGHCILTPNFRPPTGRAKTTPWLLAAGSSLRIWRSLTTGRSAQPTLNTSTTGPLCLSLCKNRKNNILLCEGLGYASPACSTILIGSSWIIISLYKKF